jgi:hypothetical protein
MNDIIWPSCALKAPVRSMNSLFNLVICRGQLGGVQVLIEALEDVQAVDLHHTLVKRQAEEDKEVLGAGQGLQAIGEAGHGGLQGCGRSGAMGVNALGQALQGQVQQLGIRRRALGVC